MPYDFEADALILRTILGTAAHDLGGVASALALRTDVLAATLAPGDVEAMRGVVEHLRALGRQLRRLRGTAGGSAFAPAREKTLAEWCALLDRFGGPVLGRGIELRVSCNEGSISPETEQALTYGMLALFQSLREARESSDAQQVVVSLQADVVGAARDAPSLALAVRTTWGEKHPAERGGDRWLAHARAVITAASLSWEGDDISDVRISGRP